MPRHHWLLQLVAALTPPPLRGTDPDLYPLDLGGPILLVWWEGDVRCRRDERLAVAVVKAREAAGLRCDHPRAWYGWRQGAWAARELSEAATPPVLSLLREAVRR